MRSTWFFLLAVFLGCDGNVVEGNPPPTAAALCDSARALRTSPLFLTVAEEADIAARVLPGGFGGLYTVGIDGTVMAFFKDPNPATQHKNNLRALLRCGAVYPGWADTIARTDVNAIGILQGRFTAAELLSYLRALEPLQSDPAIWAIEVDPEANQVWIGLADASAQSRIQQAVLSRTIPLDAVAIEVPPPTTGTEQFEILNAPLMTTGQSGVFGLPLRVRFTNRQNSVRYPQWCVDPDPVNFIAYFLYGIEKWDGTSWRLVKDTLCVSVLLPPRKIDPGASATDSVPVVATRRINTEPRWASARVTGTYRFVGKIYRATTPGDPSSEPVWLTDPAPPEENISVPFRIIHKLPF